jgi:hypothetical protein
MAEGARRILLIAPKPLLGQWRQELFQLFDIESREAEPRVGGFDGEGVFLVGRESAGSEKGRDALLASESFDLCVIDEAHEVFAGIYKRFDKFGQYNEDAPQARTAGRVRQVLLAARTPVLLLTATPIQNSLTELWGLVQFVDPLGTLLGDLPTFREVFCGEDDRQLATGQEEELRSRLRVILQRTLRRQAQEFLEKPFVNREARLFEYAMSPAEKALYDEVTTYLLEPGILAFRGSQRQLLLLGFHRRMASSTRALAASLKGVAARLRRMVSGGVSRQQDDEDAREVITDLEDDDFETSEESSTDQATAPSSEGADHRQAKNELERVEGFIRRAEALWGDDSKFRALLQALTFVTERARSRQGPGKLLIFTESLVTQTYLRDRLIESKLVSERDITLFRGTNDSPRAAEALELWRNEVPQGEGPLPQPDIATRLALVHEFKTRSRVFISTEAGAKGPFIPVNMATLEGEQARAELFGYRKGAFTGATADFLGHFRSAAGGTIFLDEIGYLTSDVQPKLLRVLGDQEVLPLGTSEPVKVDVRVVAATDRNLEDLVERKTFEDPLYYRLETAVSIPLAPLRERREDVGCLLVHFLRKEAGDAAELQRFLDERPADRPWLWASDVAAVALSRLRGNVRDLLSLARNLFEKASEAVGLSAASVRAAAYRSTLPSHHIGRLLRFRVTELLPDRGNVALNPRGAVPTGKAQGRKSNLLAVTISEPPPLVVSTAAIWSKSAGPESSMTTWPPASGYSGELVGIKPPVPWTDTGTSKTAKPASAQ